MIKKIFITLIFVLFASNAISAGSDSTPKKVKSDYDKALQSIKFAKKYESLNSDQIILAHKQSTNRTFVRTVAHKI